MPPVKRIEPDRPTLAERLVNWLPGPYFFKCLFFWIIFGTPGMVLSRYLDTLNFEKTMALFGVLSIQNVILFSLTSFVMPLYSFLAIRYMRLKIVEKKPELNQVTVVGASTVERAFASIPKLLPAAIFAVLVGVVSSVSFPAQSQNVAGVLSLIVKVVGVAVSIFAYGTFIWVYVSSIRGLYRLGGEKLRFVQFYEDKHLGMKPFGAVSFSLAWVYFIGVGLGFFNLDPLNILLLLPLFALMALGVILFFLPLYKVHAKMKIEKRTIETSLNERLRKVVDLPESNEEKSNEVADLITFQILEQKLLKISGWPFDTATLRWFSAVVISVLGTIIARSLLHFIGL